MCWLWGHFWCSFLSLLPVFGVSFVVFNPMLHPSFDMLVSSHPLLATFWIKMRPHCPVGDAVGAKWGHCEYYGRSSSIEAVTHLNASDPRHGFVITYGNGITCPSHPTLTNRVSFVITCDWDQVAPPAVFNSMYIKSDSCEHVFEFTSKHGKR